MWLYWLIPIEITLCGIPPQWPIPIGIPMCRVYTWTSQSRKIWKCSSGRWSNLPVKLFSRDASIHDWRTHLERKHMWSTGSTSKLFISYDTKRVANFESSYLMNSWYLTIVDIRGYAAVVANPYRNPTIVANPYRNPTMWSTHMMSKNIGCREKNQKHEKVEKWTNQTKLHVTA